MLVFTLLFLGHCDSLSLTQNYLSILRTVHRLQGIVLHHDLSSVLYRACSTIA